jgi:hypothetical protein
MPVFQFKEKDKGWVRKLSIAMIVLGIVQLVFFGDFHFTLNGVMGFYPIVFGILFYQGSKPSAIETPKGKYWWNKIRQESMIFPHVLLSPVFVWFLTFYVFGGLSLTGQIIVITLSTMTIEGIMFWGIRKKMRERAESREPTVGKLFDIRAFFLALVGYLAFCAFAYYMPKKSPHEFKASDKFMKDLNDIGQVKQGPPKPPVKDFKAMTQSLNELKYKVRFDSQGNTK